jgi:hypothetical protein
MAEALARDDLAAVGAVGPSFANVAQGQGAGQQCRCREVAALDRASGIVERVGCRTPTIQTA